MVWGQLYPIAGLEIAGMSNKIHTVELKWWHSFFNSIDIVNLNLYHACKNTAPEENGE
jgi:hypothetical protein